MSEVLIKHVGIILDGNRRFAKKLMLQPWKGHEWGKEKVEKLVEWAKELNIPELTLYAFSLQNFNRPKEEFDHIMSLFTRAYKDFKKDERAKDVRVRFIGRTHLFPPTVKAEMDELEIQTKDNGPFKLNFAMAYGGREEIIDAVKAIAAEVKSGAVDPASIDERLFQQHLWMESEPDLIIRTGGDHRTSNFLLWQSWYSEWFFLDKTWPEFEKEDLVACLEQFKARDRRFGC